MNIRMATTNHIILTLWWFLLMAVEVTEGGTNSSDSGDILQEILDRESYNPKLPPKFSVDEAALVTVQLVILSIDSVDESAMDYSITVYLRQTWQDDRLTFSAITHGHNSSSQHLHDDDNDDDADDESTDDSDDLAHDGGGGNGENSHDDDRIETDDEEQGDVEKDNKDKIEGEDAGHGEDHSHNKLEMDSRMIDKVWYPDTFFINERVAYFHHVTVPNTLMHIFTDGTVFYSTRLSMTLTCHMNLSKYPFDSQTCPLSLASYAYTEKKVIYKWHTEPVKVTQDVELPTFQLTGLQDHECDDSFKEDGYSCLQLSISLSRTYGYYFAQVYVPSILIVILSWVNFWLDIDAIPARISLGLLTVLTMTTMSSGAKGSLPKVSYLKAIDLWMATCLIFVFAALLEFAYVNVTSRVQKRRLSMREAVKLASAAKAAEEGKGKAPPKPNCESTKRDRARRVDKVSRVAFPAVFLCFNLFYWIFFMV